MKSNVSIFFHRNEAHKIQFRAMIRRILHKCAREKKKLVHKQKKWISKHRFGVCN